MPPPATDRTPALDCHHHAAGRCRSCTWLTTSYGEQVGAKERRCRELLAPWPDVAWEPAGRGPVGGFRNKAKMVVSGTVEDPVLGIWDPRAGGTDLRDCPLHLPVLQDALPVLAEHVTLARLTPYDVLARAGELKHVLVTGSPDGELMVRWVLRSTEALPRLRKHLPELRRRLPHLRVASVNLLPEPRAVLEGAEEVALTEEQELPMRLATGVTLRLRPQAFFQTDTVVAEELYATARRWVDALDPADLLDLFCGVGGFALHCAVPAGDRPGTRGRGPVPARRVTGVELSPEAVASATAAARDAGVGATFVAGDATTHARQVLGPARATTGAGPGPGRTERSRRPELVVVNPPRRGTGVDLAALLDRSDVPAVLYSSCNPDTLRRDLDAMPSLVPTRARVLDMFPHTGHLEVLVLLQRL